MFCDWLFDNSIIKVVDALVPLSTSSIIWYQSVGGDAVQLER